MGQNKAGSEKHLGVDDELFTRAQSGAGIQPKKDQLGHCFEGCVVNATELRLAIKDTGTALRVLSKGMR